MSDDKMRAEFEKWAKAVGHDLSQTKGDDRYWFVSTESAWESWQAAYQAGLKAEREAIFIEWENGELLAAEVERLRAELAAAKAASECPVELVALGDAEKDWWHCDVNVKCKSGEDADKLYHWLRDRMKDATPPKA